jgi:hypothetical protein
MKGSNCCAKVFKVTSFRRFERSTRDSHLETAIKAWTPKAIKEAWIVTSNSLAIFSNHFSDFPEPPPEVD